jgi:hypothetical protein
MRRIDWNPSVWLAFSAIVVAEKGGNSITPSINDPQINVRCKLIDDFEINFSVTYTVPKHVLCGLPNSPSIRMTKTQCVNRQNVLLADCIDKGWKLTLLLTEGFTRRRRIADLRGALAIAGSSQKLRYLAN